VREGRREGRREGARGCVREGEGRREGGMVWRERRGERWGQGGTDEDS
jgi:hypothetical protein